MKDNGKIWLTPKEAAEYLGIAEQTLANYRHQGIGPKYSQPVRKVYYFKEDLNDYLGR